MNPRLIQEQQQLEETLAAIDSADLVAMDTEFVAEDCYRPDLCLLQVATRDSVFLIDPKAVDVLGVWELLVSPQRRVVVHAGREEFLFAYRATNQPFHPFFDVQLALGLLGGEYPASYGKLVQRVLGTVVSKGETRTDWRRRPLTQAQLKYAALDVYYLPEVYDRLMQELEELGRRAWLENELERRQERLLAVEQQENWHRMSGLQSLSSRQLASARELWAWRERRAEERDQPPRRILRDDLLIELSRRGWTDPNKMASIRGLNHSGIKRMLPELAACVERSQHSEPPPTPWRQRGKKDKPPALLQQFMNAALAHLCRSHKLSPAIVGTSEEVGKLLSYWMAGKNLKESHPDYPLLLTGWRGELVAEPLHDIFVGRRAMRVVDPNDEMPLGLCAADDEI